MGDVEYLYILVKISKFMNYINLLFDNTNINKNKVKKEWISKNIPKYFEILQIFEKKMTFTPIKYSQTIYHYENNIIDYPKCELCDQPNKRFIGFESGYKLGCSRHCAILLTRPKSNETRRLNTIEKWGVEHTTQLKSVQDKMKNTTLSRFGVEFATQNDEIKDKIKLTNNQKYGCDLPLQNDEIKNKMIFGFIDRWGVDNPIKSPLIIDKIKKNSLIKWGTEWHISSDYVRNKIKESQKLSNYNNIISNYGDITDITILSYNNNMIYIKCHKCDTDFEITSNLLYQRHFKHKIEICLNCNPLNNRTSSGHSEIVSYLNELGISNIILNDRKLISPYEIDIYLPDYKLGIEFNGIYWHSELMKPDSEYHYNKNKMCSDSDINLIQIWEDDWNYKSDIIKSIIRNKVKKNILSIGARKCDIKVVTDKDSKVFLNDNHIQGWCVSKIRYGLYYNNELVSLITFSRGRKNINSKGDIFEITRFCNKIGINVIGSVTRLWNHFIKNSSPKSVISYSDNDFFNGESYIKLGMTLESESINYYWSDGDKRYNRWNFRKDKLVKEGFDANKTEVEIMNERGWYRCYGSGNKKYIYVK